MAWLFPTFIVILTLTHLVIGSSFLLFCGEMIALELPFLFPLVLNCLFSIGDMSCFCWFIQSFQFNLYLSSISYIWKVETLTTWFSDKKYPEKYALADVSNYFHTLEKSISMIPGSYLKFPKSPDCFCWIWIYRFHSTWFHGIYSLKYCWKLQTLRKTYIDVTENIINLKDKGENMVATL